MMLSIATICLLSFAAVLTALRAFLLVAALALAFLGATPCNASIHGRAYSGVTYYISPTGNDSHAGTSVGTAWLTPNHTVNCGDTISAAAGTYSSSNFANGKWGVVANCPSASGVYAAQLTCAGPDVASCVIADTSTNGMRVDQSNWVVIGWDLSSTTGACASFTPTSNIVLHYVAFINGICNGAMNDGINSYPYYANMNTSGVDEVAVVGAIIYNAAQGASECFSGVSIYDPKNYDSYAGTHVFIAGVFSYGNIDSASCPGESDGEGIIFDNWSNSQTSHVAYTGQGVVEQSMLLGNGSSGFEAFGNTGSTVIVESTTSWGNYQDPYHTGTYNGGLLNNGSTSTTQFTGNIDQETVSTISGSSASVYAAYVGSASNYTGSITGNYLYGVGGKNQGGSSGAYSGNTNATPNFVNPTEPSAPNCTGYATTMACMAAVVANFVPQAAGAVALGYQSPGACTPDSLYPTWLKGLVPSGLITKPCNM